MKTATWMSMLLTAVALGAGAGVAAAANESQGGMPWVEVDRLIKCHEGKFDAMDAVGQLNAEITQPVVYGGSGWSPRPGADNPAYQNIKVSAPFRTSAPVFVTVSDTVWACVTIERS